MRTHMVRMMVLMAAAVAWVHAAGGADAWAASAETIEAKVDAALVRFRDSVDEADSLLQQATGALVFPAITKIGLVIGGEYGEGALRIQGKTAAYYSSKAGSIGLQIGAQRKTVILLFMTDRALSDFRSSKGWEIGVDGSVAVVKVGAGGSLDTNTLKAPVIGFVLGIKGVMFNLTLEGTKITKLNK